MSSFECECDDDMTPDGHSPKCANSILTEYARGVAEERARIVAALEKRAWLLPKTERQALLIAAARIKRELHVKEGT